jgi:NAD(P)-dependent dehydrogenase (short-subunit alcohol dehydrogenase family)
MANVVVTGANRGIGLELVRIFKVRGDEVVALCRTASNELKALGVEIIEGVDVAAPESIADLVERLAGREFDCLINNAGILESDRLRSLDFAAISRHFEVNALGPLRISQALLPMLRSPAKIAMITSRMGSIADNGSGGSYGYRMSKAALNMASVSLARDLVAKKIAVGIFHPGMVATDMTKRFGSPASMQRADVSAAQLIARIDELNLTSSGRFLHADGQELPW